MDIGLTPVNLREATLAIEADNYTASINQVLFVPRYEYEFLHFLGGGGPAPRPVRHSWTVSLGYAQDFSTPEALSIYLMEHAGQQKTVTFTTPGRIIAATVLILPGRFGGVINQIPAATVELPLYGDPDMGGET